MSLVGCVSVIVDVVMVRSRAEAQSESCQL